MTKSAKAFLDYFIMKNPRLYSTQFKIDLAKEYGLTVEELGSILLSVADVWTLSNGPRFNLTPQQQRAMDIAEAITVGMFLGREFDKFTNPPKEKKN